ncbi:MAG: hypothetical protein Fur0041_11030 [Bacteroidia bacterium]
MKKVLTLLSSLLFIAMSAQTTLPTSWSFATTTFPNGWTANGVAYYTGSGNTPPACKLDNTGDWVQVWYASAAGPLTYYITGNSFAGGTFEVQESINGSTWTTLRTFNNANIPTNYTQFTDQPAASSRYVRFYYTTKVSGNVGLDDVVIQAAPAGPQQEINVVYNSNTVLSGGSAWMGSAVSSTTPFNFTIENQGTVNTLNIASAVITGTNAADFAVASFPATVNANSNGVLTVNFTPSAAGTRVATLTINSNDADESAYIINLFGAGGNLATVPAAPTALSFTNIKSYRFKANWTGSNPTPDGYIVLRRDGAPVTDVPSDGQTYMIGDVVGNSKVAYVGTGTFFWPNFIAANSTYYFAVFAFNGPAPYTNYTDNQPLAGNTTSSGSMQLANYYNSINTSAPTFISDLTALTNPHTDNFYSNYGQRMVSNFWARDTTGGQKVVTCVYSGENYIYTEPFAWTYFSREHSYCHSWMQTYPSTTGPEYSDYFNLFPVNQNDANAVRSNYPLGEVVNVNYTYLGCKYGTDANGRTVFEPREEQKGDAARAMMYMAVCYNSTSQNWAFPNPISTSIPYGQDQNVLKTWHYMDPPDAREIARNDYIDSLQGNRNPFIDSVNYACYIDFSNMTKINGPVIPCTSSTIGITENTATAEMVLWPNPSNGNFTLFYKSANEDQIQITVTDVSGRIVFKQMNAVSSGSNSFSLDLGNAAKGVYTINIDSENGQIVRKLVID